jgi:hypothetical protein
MYPVPVSRAALGATAPTDFDALGRGIFDTD